LRFQASPLTGTYTTELDMDIRRRITEIRNSVAAGRYANEASVAQGIVLPLLNDLGWDVFNPQVVAPEYATGGRRVDYALCDPPGKPVVFIEVKQPGNSDGADRQLFEYAFHEGVPMAVLTDGQEWNIYLPAGQGRYEDRRIYKLDLIERDLDECEWRLRRYLAFDAIRSGEAIDNAQKDYKDIRNRREAEATLPMAWRKLVEGPDELLVDLLADQVESLCGYKPDPDTVAGFLTQRIVLDPGGPPRPIRAQRTKKPTDSHTRGPDYGDLPQTGFKIDGNFIKARSAREVLIRVFEHLADRDPTFLERFASLPKHGRRRRYLARHQAALYPERPDLASEHSHEVRPGWWIGTNVSRAQVEKILQMACGVAGLKYGTDLRVKLD
jgi:hypothetical protein